MSEYSDGSTYRPKTFELTAEEVEVAEVVFNTFILDRQDLRKFIIEHNNEFNIINNLLTRIKQWQDEIHKEKRTGC